MMGRISKTRPRRPRPRIPAKKLEALDELEKLGKFDETAAKTTTSTTAIPRRSERLRQSQRQVAPGAGATNNAPKPAKQSRKRRQAHEPQNSQNSQEPQEPQEPQELPAKRHKLTRKNLARLEKMTRKKQRSTADSATRDSASKSTTTTPTAASSALTSKSKRTATTTTTTSTTTTGFAVLAFKNGILSADKSKPPANLEDIRARMAKSRESASPPQSQYEEYANEVFAASNEATMVVDVSRGLLKRHGAENKGYVHSYNQAFTAFPKDVGFNNGLSAPQPDFVEGLAMQEYWPFPVDEHVDGAVLCKDNPRSVTLPQLAGEWKGTGKDMQRAALQSAYDGAALVYARNQALEHLGTADEPDHAGITTFTTDGNNLNFYAHYAAPSEDDGSQLQYHQYPIGSTSLTSSYADHKTGRKWMRNEQDHARTQSYALRDELKTHWKSRREDVAQHKEAGRPRTGGSKANAPAPEKERGDRKKRDRSASPTSSHGSSKHAFDKNE